MLNRHNRENEKKIEKLREMRKANNIKEAAIKENLVLKHTVSKLEREIDERKGNAEQTVMTKMR